MGRGKAWTQEEDAYLREHYRQKSDETLAVAIGHTAGAVQDRRFKLGLTRRKWSAEDVEYLQDAWGSTSISGIAKNLGRSVESVKQKADKLGLGTFLNAGELVTFNQVIQAVTGGSGSYSWLREKWARHGFPFRKKKVINNRFLMVDIDDFWKWAEQHQDILDFAKFEEYALGGEPAWAKKKRRRDHQAQRRNARPWTPEEDQRLRHMLEAHKFTLDEIAEDLSRREGAIRRRIDTLGIKERPIRNPGKWWTQSEIDTLLWMHREGSSFEEIAARIGRSASACRGRYERLLNPDSMTREIRDNKTALKGFFQTKQCSHYTKAGGCDIRGTDCDACPQYRRRNPEEDHSTGWISSKAGSDGQQRVVPAKK